MNYKGMVALLVLGSCWSLQVVASSVSYGVKNTGAINCSTKGVDAAHGLWTNKFKKPYGSGGCKQYYSFQEGSSLKVAKNRAQLKATAVNPYGVVADINFSFAKPRSAEKYRGTVKNGGGGNPDQWTFYQKGKGTIDIAYEKVFGKRLYKIEHAFKLDLKDDTAFQFGVGANDKTNVLGASAWLDINKWAYSVFVYEWDRKTKNWSKSKNNWGGKWTGYDRLLGSHWDLNMELSAVPLPAGLWLFLTGLLALAGYNSRKGRA